MDSGIGAARPLRQDIFPGQSSNGRGQCALDRGRLRLHLPAGKICAIVGHRQFEIAPHFVSESSAEIASSNSTFTKFYLFLRRAVTGRGPGCRLYLGFSRDFLSFLVPE
jgi:hypothetical protein